MPNHGHLPDAHRRRPTIIRLGRLLLAIGILGAAAACGSGGLAPKDFDGTAPRFEPDRFFEGRTRSWGVFEDRSGNPTSRFTSEAVGRRDGDTLLLTQDFAFDDGRTQRREWRLRRLDGHRYEGTANDVVGVAVGEAYGNAFRWSYTLALEPGNPIENVELDQWMYLQDDGTTMLNRATISKFGVILAEVSEHFRRAGGPPAATASTPAARTAPRRRTAARSRRSGCASRRSFRGRPSSASRPSSDSPACRYRARGARPPRDPLG
jgi:hypothetical protein